MTGTFTEPCTSDNKTKPVCGRFRYLLPTGIASEEGSDQVQPSDQRIHDIIDYPFFCFINVIVEELLQEFEPG